MNTFNIYGEQIIDSFYTGPVSGKQPVDPETARQEYLKNKAGAFIDYANSYRAQFTLAEVKAKGNLDIRQVQKAMVNKMVYPNSEEIKNPTTKAATVPRLLPLELSISMDGISGIYQGNALKLQTIKDGGVLPDRYKDQVVFQVTKVNQSISDSGWETTLECLMRFQPKELL